MAEAGAWPGTGPARVRDSSFGVAAGAHAAFHPSIAAMKRAACMRPPTVYYYSTKRMNNRMSHALDLAFAALSDPTRRAIVNRLSRGQARVTDVAGPFAMSLNAVSKHLKVLERAGLVRRERLGREHILHLRPAPLRAVARWSARYERFWNRKLDALAEHLASLEQEPQ